MWVKMHAMFNFSNPRKVTGSAISMYRINNECVNNVLKKFNICRIGNNKVKRREYPRLK